jgi:hypothetical protein
MHFAGRLAAGIFFIASFEGCFAAPRFGVEVTPYINPSNAGPIREAFQAAMEDVRALPPRTGNPFRSRVDRIVQVQLTTTKDRLVREQVLAHGDSDGFTATVAGSAYLVTIIFVLADELFWDPRTGKQRPDAYVRLVNLLAHEIYGNLPGHLKLKFGFPPKDSQEVRIREEIFAFQAGIDFLERYRQSDLMASSVAKQVEEAIERDRVKMKTWADQQCPAQTIRQARLKKKG